MYDNAGAQEASPGAALRSLMAASNPLLGDSLVVLAQLAAALQFVCEEKFLVRKGREEGGREGGKEGGSTCPCA